jgi:hypothetical protein
VCVSEVTPGEPVAPLKVKKTLRIFDFAGIRSEKIAADSRQEAFEECLAPFEENVDMLALNGTSPLLCRRG